jgi:hypothetical protein
MNHKEQSPNRSPAYGLWKSQKLDGIAYQAKFRAEWDSRLRTQETTSKDDK